MIPFFFKNEKTLAILYIFLPSGSNGLIYLRINSYHVYQASEERKLDIDKLNNI